jgi:hypothetical protein
MITYFLIGIVMWIFVMWHHLSRGGDTDLIEIIILFGLFLIFWPPILFLYVYRVFVQQITVEGVER